MTDSPRTFEQALAFARAESAHRSQDWHGYCQKFVRSAYNIPSLFGSAWAQWLGADDEDKHPGGDPADAPLGSALCYKGSSPFGHIDLAAREIGAWSNDLVRDGYIDWVPRTAPVTKWGQKYLGYLTAVNDYDLQLKKDAPPKPKQTKRYTAIDKAVQKLEVSLATARAQKDHADVAALAAEVEHLKELYATLRRA